MDYFYTNLIELKNFLGGEVVKMEKEGFPDLERRKFSRLKGNFFILYFLKENPHIKLKAVIRNVGVGGLMFETEEYITKDSELALQIYQPISHDNNMIFSISVSAKVVWIRKIEKDNFEEGENKYKLGVEFLEIKEEDREIIARYVREGVSEE